MLQALHEVRSQCGIFRSLTIRLMTHLILADVREALQSDCVRLLQVRASQLRNLFNLCFDHCLRNP